MKYLFEFLDYFILGAFLYLILKTKIRIKLKRKNMKVYFARPVSAHGNLQDLRDIALLKDLGFEIINLDNDSLKEQYKTDGMSVFIEVAKHCDLIVFRSFNDGSISAGVYKEITQAGKPVLELPTITSKRVMSVEDTREYLKLLGSR